jgi:septal ring factor EnvC (AmiA/AmiB activator)
MTLTTFLVTWTLVLAAAIVVALAVYLTAIAYFLYRAGGSRRSHLARLAEGLMAVRTNAAPLERQLAAAAQALAALRHELQQVEESLTEAAQAIRR